MTADERSLRGGRYVLRGVLGSGTQGQTLEALDTETGTVVAIKRFDVRGAKSWKDVELAEREARVLSSLSHPALPAYIEHFEEGSVLFLVMQKIEGASLAVRKKRGPSFGEAEAVRLLSDAAGVLSYLHGGSPPIVHRDIKPSNVIQRPDGSFAFVDFGAVRDRMKVEGGSTVVGTFGYMAPEQFQGRALPASDVYALGATTLAMLTGVEPEALAHRGLSIDVAAALGDRVSAPLVRTLERMLEPDPDRRAADVSALVHTLQSGKVRSRARPTKPLRAARVRPERSRAGRIGYLGLWIAYGFAWWTLWPLFGHSWILAVALAVLAVYLGRVGGWLVALVEKEVGMIRSARRSDLRIRVESTPERAPSVRVGDASKGQEEADDAEIAGDARSRGRHR